MLWVSLTCSTTFMLETIRPARRQYLNQWVWNEWIHHKLPVKISCTYILKTNDVQFINEVVKCPKYCALTIWPVLLFLRILNWIESSLWMIRCLRPTFAVIGDFQMQWSDGQKLGNLWLSAIWDVSSWCTFFCSYGRTESMPTVYICVFCSRLVSWLHVPPPHPHSLHFPRILAFTVLKLLLFLG